MGENAEFESKDLPVFIYISRGPKRWACGSTMVRKEGTKAKPRFDACVVRRAFLYTSRGPKHRA